VRRRVLTNGMMGFRLIVVLEEREMREGEMV
jgi:hypothetical protein